MRIAFAAQQFPPSAGGISTQTAAKAYGLAALGHEVHVVTHSLDGNRSERYRDGVHVIRIPGAGFPARPYTEAGRWLGYSVAVAAELTALADGPGLDVVDLPDYGGEGYAYLAGREPRDRAPVTVQLHGPLVMLAHTIGWPEPGSTLHEIGIGMERACVRLAERIYSSSSCSADWCRRHYGAPTGPVPTLHTGVDIDRFRPVHGAERHGVVFVGRIAESKGVLDLLDAVLAVTDPPPRLRLTAVGPGEPDTVRRLVARAAAAGRPDVLELRRPLDHDELPAVLARAAVVALPSHYEGGPGLVYLEAMACGVPVVATAAGGAVEVVQHGHTGLVVPPGDVPALTGALQALLTDPPRAARMGHEARAYVERNADRRRCLRRLESLLQEVVEDGHR
ncbi:glycosyltransferase family 4 protein [Couchioplanes caeruleus]|uniref:Glycosyltransferase n=2 Tax=Couchioplanes caeruleus TaxID=56438 RepID=A0A1K0FPE0_9ACTN|nr:glycosyltransferase family 4 protein [Couchioplanes caeruleus]OJF14709.1 hypothetical protein BG844_08340 [Couchioplanes caeruleus subsp. caeruleus]OJF15965.1 Glycosyltransferase [Couchioplanes caeruleus subsp. caeruleus]ROP28556.1 glycosyltransferase involved in cell wall biosynthesis [Couchioplanes caeruleus]